jgi:hypothetical protein
MIDWLRELLQVLVRDDLSVADVVGAVGPVLHDPGIPGLMELTPPRAGVRAVTLARYPQGGAPFYLTATFDPAHQPSVADLEAAFGPYRRLRNDRGTPVHLQFEPSLNGREWAVALVADLPPDTTSFGNATATSVMLRRDPITAASLKAVTEGES